MFQKKQPEENGRSVTKGATIIAVGTTFKGDIECSNDLRIDGLVEGNIKSSSRVVIGTDGCVKGNVHSLQADLMGQIAGNIFASESLTLRGNACVNGDIHTRSLNMEPGVVFNGRCRMTAEAEEKSMAGEKVLKPEKQKLAVAN